MKQLFYAVCVVVLMVIAYRLMKRVDKVPEEWKNKSPQEWKEDIAALEEEIGEEVDDEHEKCDEYGKNPDNETEK